MLHPHSPKELADTLQFKKVVRAQFLQLLQRGERKYFSMLVDYREEKLRQYIEEEEIEIAQARLDAKRYETPESILRLRRDISLLEIQEYLLEHFLLDDDVIASINRAGRGRNGSPHWRPIGWGWLLGFAAVLVRRSLSHSPPDGPPARGSVLAAERVTMRWSLSFVLGRDLPADGLSEAVETGEGLPPLTLHEENLAQRAADRVCRQR